MSHTWITIKNKIIIITCIYLRYVIKGSVSASGGRQCGWSAQESKRRLDIFEFKNDSISNVLYLDRSIVGKIKLIR